MVSSNIVQITGLAGTIGTSVTGGAYRICADATCAGNPSFINTPSTLTNGAYLQLRTTSSGTVNTTVAVAMVVGVGSTTWTVTSSDQDSDPDPFAFSTQTGVAASTPVSSAIVPITGIAGNVSISIAGGGGLYRVCADASCATNPTFTAGATTITAGSYAQLRLTSSGSALTPVSTTLTIGTASATWTVTTADDTTPTAFSFTDLTGASLSTSALSNVLPISGITTGVPVSIAGGGGTFRVCTDATCSTSPAFGSGAGTIGNGQYLQLRLTSSASFLTAVSTTVTVGGVADTWSVTTMAQDATPNSFAFVNQTGVPLSTVVASNTVQVTGITGNVPVSISGGSVARFRVCPSASCTGVSYQTAATTIANGQYLGLQQTSSGANGATVTETVTVGTVSTPWSVTTLADPCAGSPAVGTACADGSKFAGYSPVSGTKMYATAADYPGAQQFAWPEDFFGYTGWLDGRANTNGLAVVGSHPAAAACYYLTAHGKSDWYLPSPTEMNAIDPSRNAIGGFQPDDTSYWTSTEVDGGDWHAGLYHVMGSTFNGYTGMGIGMPIRCIRRD